MVWWMKYQIFLPILLLQFLNLFWYFLAVRIGYRYVHTTHKPYRKLLFVKTHIVYPIYRALTDITVSDTRSDDEDDGAPDDENDKED